MVNPWKKYVCGVECEMSHGFPFSSLKPAWLIVRRARMTRKLLDWNAPRNKTDLLGIRMTQILIFSAIISFFIWQGWRTHNKWVISYIGQRQWYRSVYLFMPSWRLARWIKLSLSGHRCKRCKTTQRIDCHHLSYTLLGKSILYWEWLLPFELQCLCRSCHEIEHG